MNQSMEITSCEVCGNGKLRSMLNLGTHPLCDDLVEVGDTRICREYPIEILYCDQCVTAHQRFQVPKRELFPTTYHYRSRFTLDVLNGMTDFVNACEERLGSLDGKVVLDVGCNDGSLLDRFAAKGCTTIGIEPTDAYEDALGKGHQVHKGFFSEESANEILKQHGRPDVITFTNVFAHIEDLSQLTRALRALMGESTMLVIENHHLGSILDGHQFDTFYHEHPRTYSLTSFFQIARNLAVPLSDVQFPSRYGGNIRVFLGGPPASRARSEAMNDLLQKERGYQARFEGMQADVSKWKTAASNRLDALFAKHGPLAAKAFPGRAAILIKLLELDSDVLDAVFEKPGSMKVGHYLPGTRVPIKSDAEFFARQDKPPAVVNLAWHISSEIRTYMEQNSYRGELVDILDKTDFT